MKEKSEIQIKTVPRDETAFQLSPEDLAKIQTQTEQKKEDFIGQERALKALVLGTGIQGRGYNIFVSGPPGTGRHSAIRSVLKEMKERAPRLRDIAYVYNFERPEHPGVLYFPPGEAAAFKKELHELVENLKSAIRLKVESDYYQEEKNQIISVVEEEENRRLADFETNLADSGFRIIQVEEEDRRAADLALVINGEETDFQQLQEMVGRGGFSKEEWNSLREKYYYYMDEMKTLFHELRLTRETMKEELEALKKETITPAVLREVEKIRDKYADEDTLRYLNSMEDDIKEHLFLFTREQADDGGGNPALIRYGINIIVRYDKDSAVPILFEDNPGYQKLFGSIEYQAAPSGETRSSFMMIRAGSLVRASGGFIIIDAEHLREENTWHELKRVLKTGKVEIQEKKTSFSFPGSALQPEPVEVDIRVIIVGIEDIYDDLYEQDEDIQKLFKISAEFSAATDNTKETLAAYIHFLRRYSKKEGFLDPSDEAVCAILEYAVRLAEDRKKISTRFSEITDLLREGDYWARRGGNKEIRREDIRKAREARREMFNLPEEQLDELILHKDIILQTEGSKIGQVNGIALYERGYYSFGRPVVISARVAPGNEGVVNIEREVGLSGEIHDKGILIMEGYLRSTYARDFPLSIFASICFEQSYSEIDGDSASSSEMYALLSAIANLPLRQDIAVTGSLNQMGYIQPVGGITEKVEGFYRICKKMGLNGSQGILIPEKNRVNLVLDEDVVEAIEKGIFHVYPVTTVEEGMEILTGKESGQRDSKGEFPDNTINNLIQTHLREMAEQMKSFNG